jgi:hypothetical protein
MALMQWLAGMVRRPVARRRGSRSWSDHRRWNRPLVLEALESRWCPALTLTQAGIDLGLSLSTFADGFPSQSGAGPSGIAFPSGGGVLVSDVPGNVRLFPADTDGQHAPDAPVGQTYGFLNAVGLAQVGDNIYMTQFLLGTVVQINTDGTFNQVIVNGLRSPTGMIANPANGHLFVSLFDSGRIVDVDPIARTVSPFADDVGMADGFALSADGSTLYTGRRVDGHIIGFDTQTQQEVFDSGLVGEAAGIAVGTGSLAGNLYVNTLSGTVIEVNLAQPDQQVVVASDGSRGAYVTIDPNDGSALLTQTDTIERLTFPSGGGGGGRGGAPAARMGQEHLAIAVAFANSRQSKSPAIGLSPQQPVGQYTPSSREQTAITGSASDSQPSFVGRYALDSFFAAHHKGSQHMDSEGSDTFALGLSLDQAYPVGLCGENS